MFFTRNMIQNCVLLSFFWAMVLFFFLCYSFRSSLSSSIIYRWPNILCICSEPFTSALVISSIIFNNNHFFFTCGRFVLAGRAYWAENKSPRNSRKVGCNSGLISLKFDNQLDDCIQFCYFSKLESCTQGDLRKWVICESCIAENSINRWISVRFAAKASDFCSLEKLL